MCSRVNAVNGLQLQYKDFDVNLEVGDVITDNYIDVNIYHCLQHNMYI